MPEKCALSHGSGVLGRDPRDSCRFWSPHVRKVCTVTQFRLGEGGWGGGIPLGGGGGSANREPGSYIWSPPMIYHRLFRYVSPIESTVHLRLCVGPASMAYWHLEKPRILPINMVVASRSALESQGGSGYSSRHRLRNSIPFRRQAQTLCM